MNRVGIASRAKIATGPLGAWADYLMLVKPRLLSLVVLSVLVGFYLAARAGTSAVSMFGALTGAFLVAAGSMALNQVLERDTDRAMMRTQNRPIPSGRLGARKATRFGLACSVLGLVVLILFANLLSTVIALATTLLYLGVYTPLKPKTSLATIVGAVPGALPPLIGWAAARGSLDLQALVLFLVLFFWQMPHFLSIAWIYREDYARAGLPTLSVLDRGGSIVARQMMLYLCALMPVSLCPTILGMTGTSYFFGAFVLGICFSAVAIFAAVNLDARARYVLRASIIYLAVLFILMTVDKAA